MKKKVFSLMMTLVFAFIGLARANEVTVYEGTTTNNYVPAYVYYFDDFTRSQYVIPAADLASVNGGTITSVKFYTTSSNMPYTTVSTVDVYLKEVDYTSISAFEAKADCQVVYTGTLEFFAEGAGGACVINFSTPFPYNGGNLLVGCENTTDDGWKNIYFYGQTVSGASVAGYNSSSLDNVTATQRNFIPKTTITYSGGTVPPVPGLHVKYLSGEVEVIDELNLGVRPAGAWMEPFNFVMFSDGPAYTVNVLDFTPSDGLFTVSGEELPFDVVPTQDVDLMMSTNGTQAGVIERQFVAITEGDRAAHIWPVTVELYAPEIPDVWEKACTEATTFPFVEVPATAHHTTLHNDYTLPFPEIPEGVDAVYKLVFDHDMVLNASVTYGNDGKVALYTADFNGEGGPMATNNYNGTEIFGGGGGAASPYEAQLGEGTSTSGYLPFYCYYNYSLSQQLYLPAELQEAGVTRASMNSISWYCTATNNNLQSNITIWIANVGETAVDANSPLTSNMTKVYEGNMTPVANAWNEFVFNTGSFAWDGNSSILVVVQRNNGAWASGVSWQVGAQNFNAGAYKYSDTEGPYNMETTSYSMTTTTNRANTIFKSVGRRSLPMLSTSTNNPGVNTNSNLNRDGWMFYDNGVYGTSVGVGGGVVYWGSRFPASMITENRLTKVALYENDYNIDPITLYVYQGGSEAPGTLVYSQTFTPVGGDQFHEVNLTSPVTIDPSQHLWIVFSENGTYPANACEDTGYADNRWVSLDGVDWYDVADLGVPGYGWMIRAYLANNAPVPPGPGPDPTPTQVSYSAGPVIEGLPVTPGTYYLVASSTTPDFEVTINGEEMPCPTVEEFAFNPQPADNEDELEPAAVTLRWMIPEYATGWRLIFGSTYYPDPNHSQTVIYPEDGSFTRDMANSYTVRNLWNNTNYFWRVEFNNDGCPEGVSSPIWGFTTHLNVPQNLTVADETVFNDEPIVLSWNAVVDRTYRMYNVYRDGVLIGHTTVNNIGATTYTDDPQPYNMAGYTYYVTAVYDEGESAHSNSVTVRVSGRGNVNGHVYEQDGTTGIANATVTMVGPDEFGVNHTYNFQTNAQGYYSGAVYAGIYDGQAAKDGYQTDYVPEQGEPITVVYNETSSPYDYILDENFDPVCSVIAEYYPDDTCTAPYVKVSWGCGLPGEEIIEPFETGDFSQFDWQLDPAYPWSITTNNPYEGTYCMKSGGAGVANVVSNMTVTVNIPADGVMSYFGKISSETNWDYGYFYIDGVQKAQYTGAGNWAEKSFDITAGDHTFKWSYTKDGSVNSNDDCFYVDYITFYKRPEPPQPAQPGWHTYAQGDFNNAVGSNVGTSRWAYEYPVSIIGGYAGMNLTKVSLFSDNMYSAVGGNYTCTIYQGGSLPMEGTAVSTITVDVPQNMNAWVDFDLTTPVPVTGSDKLWVVWTANTHLSNWPAGCCDGLVDEGTWWSAGLEAGYEWDHQTYGTWTMRQYFTNREGRGFYSYASDNAPVAVDVPAVVKGAPVTPVKGVETVTTICANPNAVPSASVATNTNRALSHYRVYRTNCYNDGPYTEENTLLLATVWVPDTVYIDVDWPDAAPGVYKWGVGAVYAGNRGEEINGPIHWAQPVDGNRATLTYDFNDGTMDGWTTIDADGDGFDWEVAATLDHQGNTYASVASASYDNTYGALTPNNFFVSPQVTLGGTISFWACAQDNAWAAEHFGVAVSTTSNNNASAFTMVSEWTMTAKGTRYSGPRGTRDQGQWYQYTADLSAYAGQTGYVAIRHFNSTDWFRLNVDDVTIVEGGGTPGPGPDPGPTPDPGTIGLQEPRESEIVWSNCLDKDMWLEENVVDINVLLNSADSPEGVTVNFVNLNEAEQELYPIDEVVLDGTGFYAWNRFRKGDYQLTITMDGYVTIQENVSIWEPTSLRYVMIEIIYGVDNLYVSRTGWAMWEGHGEPGGGGGGGGGQGGGEGDTFSVDFEAGLPSGWTLIDADGDGYNWNLSSNTMGTGYGHNGSSDMIFSQSYDNNYGALTPDNYLVSPQVTLAAGSTFSFYACAQDASWAAEHFGVAISDNGTSGWTMVQEWTMTAKSGGDVMSIGRDGQTRAQGNWYQYTVDLSAYAGQKYIAIRHFNCTDMFYLDVDDITLTSGAKSGDRHLEYYKVMCESIDHEPIFNINTPHNFCQVATDELVEGELYICKVAAVYSTGMSDYAECIWEYESCENYPGTVNGLDVNGTTVTWDYPGGGVGPGPQPGQGDSFSENFDSGMPSGWTTVDADGDGYTWVSSMNPGVYHNAGVDLTGTGHNASTAYVISGSYANGLGMALTPDNYLVSPQVTLAAGSTFSFYACAQDASWAAEHFGVAISDNGTSGWTMVQEWTMTAKGGNVMSAGRSGNTRAQGNWYQYTVDLSAYAGQKYIGIRHFNCTDMFILNVDDITLTAGGKSNRAEWTFANGFVTDPGAMANGADASWIKGSQSTYGPGCQQTSNNWVADSFTLDAATTIDQIVAYGYQTGSSTTSTFTGLYAQIYNGNPMNGAAVVWGDANTNIMTATAFTNCYRGSDGDATGTTRPIMSITADGLNIQLEAGTYYLAYQLTGTGSSGPWGQPHAEPGVGNTGNGVQYLGSNSAWQPLSDSGAGTSYGVAMSLHGNSGAPGPGPGPTPGGNVLGAMVFLNGEWEAFVAAPTNSYEFPSAGEYCVRIVYNGTADLPSNNFYYAMSCEECEGNTPGTCEPGDPIHAEVLGATDQVRIWWGVEPAAPINEWLYYDDGEMQGSVGAGGAIYWGVMFPAASLQAYAGTNLTQVAVMEYDSPGTYTANIYLGGTSAPATLVSTQNFNATGTGDWNYVTLGTPVPVDGTQNLWITMYQSGITYPATGGIDTGDANGRWVSVDGNTWYDIIDASSGSIDYTWLLRGFVTNQAKGGAITELPEFVGEVGGELSSVQVTPVAPAFAPMNRADIVKYNVYRSDDANGTYALIGEVLEAGQTLYEYFDTPETAGTYYYQVKALYSDGCESDPAMSADDPTHNYVSANVDAIGENSDNVALYPNPTKDNVKIEANGMSRITVVSMLGQVIFDTEVNANVYTLNMSQFKAGMYMVRVYTESGVTVKRVTVMQ